MAVMHLVVFFRIIISLDVQFVQFRFVVYMYDTSFRLIAFFFPFVTAN